MKEISSLNAFDVVKLGAVAAYGAMPATIFSPNKPARRRVQARRQAYPGLADRELCADVAAYLAARIREI